MADYILDCGWGRPTQRQELEAVTVEVIGNPLDPETTYLEMLKAGARLHQPTSVPATKSALKPDPHLFACG